MVAALGTAARADNITMSGVSCKNYNASEALDIDYRTWGVQNVNTAPRWVICPVPRSPLTSVPPTEFYVDGSNSPGTSTSCQATLYDYQGNITATVSFIESATTWDHPVTFSVAPSMWDYVNVMCQLPGSRGGTLLGTAAVQP
ncbi:MAG TPA: hypothetical protein VF469_01080 [Kofleriaceae bacterium]